MQITVLSVNKESKPGKNGKQYNCLNVAYKGDDGKVAGKNVTEFSKAAYSVLSNALNGEVYTVTSVKNDSGFWEWSKVEHSTATTTVEPMQTNKAYASPKSTYETPEERAIKQVYIVRQSSISNAIAFVKEQTKKPTVHEVLAIAKQFEEYVFNSGDVKEPQSEIIQGEVV